MTGVRVLGIDACKAGWIGVILDSQVSAQFAPTISDLVEQAEASGLFHAVAVDMPIGLPDSGPRQADRLARERVGPRGRSVFQTPVRQALQMESFAEANAKSRELTGTGVSQQAFALRSKLREVDKWIRDQRRVVVEVHPEVSFAEMAQSTLPFSKATWAGVEHRRQLLAAAGIELGADLGPAGARAAVDDVLDAGAAAWSARRVATGQAQSLPPVPEHFSDNLPSAIWF